MRRATFHPPFYLAQHILAAAGEELMIRLQVRAVHQKRGPGLDLAALQRRRLEIADQVTGARRRILGPGHPGVEPGHPHLEIALVLLEDRQVAERRQLAVRLPARDVLAAGHEVEDIVGEEIEPLLELALVEQPSLADVELHQLEPQRLLRCQRHRGGRGLVRALRLHPICARERTQFRQIVTTTVIPGRPGEAEPGTHIPEACVHRFRARPYPAPRNDAYFRHQMSDFIASPASSRCRRSGP